HALLAGRPASRRELFACRIRELRSGVRFPADARKCSPVPDQCDADPLHRLSETWTEVRRWLSVKRAAQFAATSRPIFARKPGLSLRIGRRARRGLANTSGLTFLSTDSRTPARFQSHRRLCQVSCAAVAHACPLCACQ